LPLALGVPAGALGGYFYRRWQESHPGKYIPWISGEADEYDDGPWDLVGGEPWQSIVGGPWVDIVGTEPQLPPIAGPVSWVDRLTDTRFWAQTGYKPGHQLDSNDPADAQMIPIWLYIREAVVRESRSQPSVSGEPWQSIIGTEPWQSIIGGEPWQSIIGGEPWVSIVGQALDVLRRQAQVAAREMPGRVIGIIRDANNQWALKSFRDADSADDWFGRVTRDKSRFTYAAYFDKNDPMFPHPLNEEIGSAHAPAVPPSPIPRVVAEVP
jgi:hypothetical protein